MPRQPRPTRPPGESNDGRWSGLLDVLMDADGRTPCEVPDSCDVCRLFSPQQPGETREAWLRRLVG